MRPGSSTSRGFRDLCYFPSHPRHDQRGHRHLAADHVHGWVGDQRAADFTVSLGSAAERSGFRFLSVETRKKHQPSCECPPWKCGPTALRRCAVKLGLNFGNLRHRQQNRKRRTGGTAAKVDASGMLSNDLVAQCQSHPSACVASCEIGIENL